MVAIHKLLLAQADKLPGSQKMSSLKCSGGTERPARPARTLVFPSDQEKQHQIFVKNQTSNTIIYESRERYSPGS